MMKNFIRLVKIVIVCVLAISGSSGAIASDYSSNYESIPAMDTKPTQVGKWRKTPRVVVCKSAPVDEISARSAVAFWIQLGYAFRTTLYKIDIDACNDSTPNGYIIVHLVSKDIRENMDADILAETHFYVDRKTKEIGWAKIYLVTSPPALVLEHEIGHAMGFLHYNKNGHLMNEKLIFSGWGTEGISR